MCSTLAECFYFRTFNPKANHGEHNEWDNVCSPIILFSRAFALYDITGDFLFWGSLLHENAVSESIKTSILAFAIIGLVIDCMHGCGLCCNVFVFTVGDRIGAGLSGARRGKL